MLLGAEGTTISSTFEKKILKFCGKVVCALNTLVGSKATTEQVINDHHTHFRKIVKDNLSLPITDPDQVVVLNNALHDKELSISLVRAFFVLYVAQSL